MCCHMHKYYSGNATSMASLPSGRITSKICSLTFTFDIKDNPLPDALLSDNSSNCQDTAAILSLMACRGISKFHNQYQLKCT